MKINTQENKQIQTKTLIKPKILLLNMMLEAIRTELLYDIDHTIEILEQREEKDIEELKDLSNHAINDVAVHKNLDLISITVLIYSLYKIVSSLPKEEYKDILQELKSARDHLKAKNLARYNQNIETIFQIIRKCDKQVKVHLQDVMQAARIKKSAELLHKGLSIGQAAGLMGLSNWDLQQYVGKTNFAEHHKETTPVKKRLDLAMKIFNV